VADHDPLQHELAELRRRCSELLQRATDAEQALEAFARGEVDAVALEASASPVLLQAAQNELRRNEMLLRAIFDGALDAMLLADDDRRFVDANPAACALLGLTRSELIGRQVADFASPEYDGAHAGRELRAAGRMRGRLPLRRPDGSRRTLEYSAVADVAPGLHLSVLRDITEQIEAEDALRRSEALFRAVIEKSSEVVSLTSRDGSTRYLTPLAAARLGWSVEEMGSQPMRDLVVSEDRAKIAEALQNLVSDGGRDLSLEFRVHHRDGSIRWIESSGTNLLDDPSVGAIVGNYRDITARKRAEEAVNESHSLLEEAQAIAHVGSWALVLGTRPSVTWTREAMRIFGVDEGASLTFEDFVELVHPEDRDRVVRAAQNALEHDTTYDFDYRIVHADGSIRWAHGRAAVERDDSGRATRLLGSIQDVTDRYLAVAALRASEERYRLIIESTSEGVWLSDASFRTTYVNQRAADMLGYTREEMIGESMFMCLTEEACEPAMTMRERRMRGGSETYQSSYRRKDGSTCWTLAKANTILDESGRFAGSVELFTDVSGQRQLEAARDHLAAIVESSEDTIVGISLGGVITSWNFGAEKLYQYSRGEAVGRPLYFLVPREAEAEQRRILATVASGEAVGQYESKRVRKDGSLVDVAIIMSPVRDALGAIVGVSKIGRDLTARRVAEAAHRKTEDQFRQAQKMEAVGRLAGGIAHDFNNLLSVVMSYASLAMDGLKVGDPLLADLREIETAGRRATELTKQLLAFSRQQILQPRVVDLNRIIAGMGSMLRRLLGEDVELTTVLGQEVGRVLADPGQLEQVVMNLAVNARDAMPQGGKLTIATSNTVLELGQISGPVDAVPGPYVLLAISDNGVGMDAETRSRIFEPFFTTKPVGKGTGLGLATVFGIVQQSGGYVSAYSELGVGTTFKIHLPRTDRGADPVVDGAPPPLLRGNETILLVEDEAQVRVVAATILRRYGYNVLETSNGGEAYLVSREFPAKIHLLLTDVVMPRMSGRKLSEELASQRPEMKVLFASGYTDDAIVHHGVLESGVALLQKPFTPEGLLRKVREVLDGVI
jgi:two-component system cell cycle sensor histidine kinase/response regulator CckA